MLTLKHGQMSPAAAKSMLLATTTIIHRPLEMKLKVHSAANAQIAENWPFGPVLAVGIFIARNHVKLLTGIHTNGIVLQCRKYTCFWNAHFILPFTCGLKC